MMKRFLTFILNKLNVHPDRNQEWILFSSGTYSLISTYIMPRIQKATIEELSSEWLAFQSLVFSLTIMMISVLWKSNFRKNVIRYFPIICAIESFCGFFLGMYLAFVEWNVMVFAITSLIYGSLVVTIVSKAVLAFRSVLWIERKREIYDNNREVVHGIVCIIGFSMALLFMPSLKTALILWSLECIIDDVGWVVVYMKNRKILRGI